MGSFLTYRIAGGEQGMHHFLEQFGPALQWPWTKLVDVPELDSELIDRIATQSDDQAAGLSVRDLERLRDDNLVAILQALRARRYGAGEILREHETRLYEAGGGRGRAPDPTAPLRLHETAVDPSSVDYNGHMTEARYGVEFGYATDAFLRHVGLDAAYLDRGHSAYTVEGHVRFLREAAALEPIVVDTQVLAADEKRLHLFHSMRHGGTEALLATGEYLLLHVDTGEGRTCPWKEPVASRVSEAAAAHTDLPVPEGAGRAVSMSRAG
jgi:carnitine 3-dehydrogenase